MRVIRIHSNDVIKNDRPSVVAIGNFDGVHLGHQSIFNQLNDVKKKYDAQSTVIFFEPQPVEFLKPDIAPARLSSLKEKIALMEQHRIDTAVVLRFDQPLSQMSGEAFCKRILVDGLGTRHVIIGDDFRFAKDRSAGIEELRSMGQQHGFTTEQANRCEYQQQRISSSWVRKALAAGDFTTVSALLGRQYSICGTVIHGDKRGRELGYPTANIKIKRHKPALAGVYITSTLIGDAEPIASVSNFGTRPMFDGDQILLETHLFDYDADLYGQKIQILFHKHLRPEQKLGSLSELKKQIDLDSRNAREFHGLVISD